MNAGFDGIWKDMVVDMVMSGHCQVICLDGLKKDTKIAASIIDEMRDTNQKSPEKKLWENFTYF